LLVAFRVRLCQPPDSCQVDLPLTSRQFLSEQWPSRLVALAAAKDYFETTTA